MGASKDTPHIRLSQFQDNGVDKPSFLSDYNGDMLKIDTAIEAQRVNNETTANIATTAMTMVGEAKTTADGAKTAADAATTAANTATTKANTAITESAEAKSSAASAVSRANAATGDANTALTSANQALTLSQDSALRYNRPTHAVFIGNSQSIDSRLWVNNLCTRSKWTGHNYSVSGMGYTFGGADSYEGQISRAKNDSSFANAEVGFVFIVDASNDVRMKNEIAAPAATVFAAAKAAFPMARIIAVPFLYSPNDSGTQTNDREVARLFWLSRLRQDLHRAAINYGVEWIDGSWSWHLDEGGLMLPNDIHYTAAGYSRILYMVEQYLKGSSTTWIDTDWIDPVYSTPVYTAVASGNTEPIRARREKNTVTVQGAVKPTTAVNVNDIPVAFPKGVKPVSDITSVAWQDGVPLNCTFMANGQVKMWTARSSASLLNFSVTYGAI